MNAMFYITRESILDIAVGVPVGAGAFDPAAVVPAAVPAAPS